MKKQTRVKLSVVVHTCNPSCGKQREVDLSELEASLVDMRIPGQSRLHSKTLIKYKTRNRKGSKKTSGPPLTAECPLELP